MTFFHYALDHKGKFSTVSILSEIGFVIVEQFVIEVPMNENLDTRHGTLSTDFHERPTVISLYTSLILTPEVLE